MLVSPLHTRFKTRPTDSRRLSTRLILVRQRWLWVRRAFFARKSAMREHRASLQHTLDCGTLVFPMASFISILGACLAFWNPWPDKFAIGLAMIASVLVQESVVALLCNILSNHEAPRTTLPRHLRVRQAVSCTGQISSGASHAVAPYTQYPHGLQYTVFVKGTAERLVQMRVLPSATVADVLARLTQAHLAAESARLTHYLVFDSFRAAPLDPDQTLLSAGIQHGSTIHFRTRLRGGAPTGRDRLDPVTEAILGRSFTKESGRFGSKDPDVWLPLTGENSGVYKCRICDQNIESNRTARHERQKGHLRALARHRARQHALHEQPSSQHAFEGPELHDMCANDVQGPLLDVLHELSQPSQPKNTEDCGIDVGMDWEGISDTDVTLLPNSREQAVQVLAGRLERWMMEDIGDDEESSAPAESDGLVGGDAAGDFLRGASEPNAAARTGVARPAQAVGDLESVYFPWPDRTIAVLDILNHVPRCAFSVKQNTVIHWALSALGLPDVPRPETMRTIDEQLQKLCGIRSIRYDGAHGHTYYVNDIGAIIAQEMANPRVRPHLHFLPEDAGNELHEAWQADKWLHTRHPGLGTPMVRSGSQDFYIFEPAMLRNQSIWMPFQWFIRNGQVIGRVWGMEQVTAAQGWLVREDVVREVPLSQFLLSFHLLQHEWASHGIEDPHNILGRTPPVPSTHVFDEENGSGPASASGILPWTRTDPSIGNRWRARANGRRVVAFPMWLYTDDTSGNSSKKWNKHNSFLFTAAGLPRQYVHREANIHYLSTSNLAPPLEQLDGISDQIELCQQDGIWAFDVVLREMVLVIPSVLALLGDNPMQSELACHIGLQGKLFCRMCWVQGDVEGSDEHGTADDVHRAADGLSSRAASPTPSTGACGSDIESTSTAAGSGDDSDSVTPCPKGRKKKLESMAGMLNRIRNFMKVGRMRDRTETQNMLGNQYADASRVGGKTAVKKSRTESGIKDTFQHVFLERLFDASTARNRSKAQKQGDLTAVIQRLPDTITSPVLRLKGVDPHLDTPVEILHVILLGHVKYFWRDAIQRLNADQKKTLIARLASVDVRGLQISPITARTFVQYAGSLVGRDFRAIAQIAPFVLYDLLPSDILDCWASLSTLVPLVWQPDIYDIDRHISALEQAIDRFLMSTCRWTPRWFNKPKFHILLHLPAHVRRFGPAILFATEGFESFNAIIRGYSIHSNRHAPSRDIAHGMARANRTRHLLCGGYFLKPSDIIHDAPALNMDNPILPGLPWLSHSSSPALDAGYWTCAAAAAQGLLDVNNFGSRILGLSDMQAELTVSSQIGDCYGLGESKRARRTHAAKIGLIPSSMHTQTVYTAKEIVLSNGDHCLAGDWLIWSVDDALVTAGSPKHKIGRLVEILQMPESGAFVYGKANAVVLELWAVGELHPLYLMPRLIRLGESQLVHPRNLQCSANVQHNCADNNCSLTASRERREEREKTGVFDLATKHTSNQDFILNIAKMRDAAILQHFRRQPPALSTATVEDAVRREIDMRRTPRASTAKATSQNRRAPASGLSRPTVQSINAVQPSPLARLRAQ